jgi:D-glycero-D-manno-heptose 1,7-bisphosphate phosphatase
MMQALSGLILLDRDGTLNKMVIDPEHGTIDSPLHPSQVELYDRVPEALVLLQKKNYGLVIVTNQPAYAKGKTTFQNLKQVHDKVVQFCEAQGAKFLSSHICFHRSEDGCDCRKPKTGLLNEAFSQNPAFLPSHSWMVGDGVHDIRAGQTLSVRTAFIGPKKWDAQRVFDGFELLPTLWVENLFEFAQIVPECAR